MIKKLFLDDYRLPEDVFRLTLDFDYEKNSEWVIVKSYNDFIEYLLLNSMPELISFDHDLSQDHYLPNNQYKIDYNTIEKTGYHALVWLINHCNENKIALPKCKIHSQNSSGKENMNNLLNQYL